MFARKDPVFYSDGVQLGMYMAVIEREFRRLEAKYGRGDSVLPVIERNWRAVEVAEAACMEAVNMNEFTSDAPGKKQQFAINSWYAQSFEVLGGLGFSVDALTVLSSSVDRGGWTYRNLRLGKGVLDVVFTGKGRHVAALTLDGKPVAGVSVPMKDLVVGRHEVKVALSEVDGLRFNHLYSSHMVLQRGEPIRLAGFAPAGRRVSVTFKDVTKETTADQANAWAVTFPAEQAGGPYAFVAKDGVSAVTLDDVMVGDVWFCTGQSNMWWPMCRSGEAEKEIAAANHPNIRLLDVALTGAAEEVGEPPYVRGWSRCTPETVRNFSACGYHFARTVREKLGDVAIGLVGAGWGGPPISHFLPCAKPSGAYAELAREALAASAEGFADEDRLRALCRDFLGSDARLAAYANGPTEPGASVKVTLPCKRGLEHTVLKNFSGVALFRRTVEVPDAWIGQDLVVELGSTTLPSAVLVNGVCVGRTKDWDAPVPGDVGSVPNRCVVKATDVRKGANEICAFLGCNERLSWWSGFYGELKLMPKDRPEVSVSLAGDTWTCEKAITVPETGRTYGGSWCARIHPFFQLPVKGVLFYQGEADSKRPAADYLKDQKLLISLLRQGWQKPTLPYYCMQLANHARKRNGENGFCEIREAQRLTAEEVPFTGTACSIDVGEDLNIHPLNKREQGRRLALQALKKTYGCADVVADGPSFLKLERTGKTATVVYKPSSAKLVLKGEKLTGFEACAKDGAWQAVEAELAGDRVKLTAPFEIAHVRYLWQNFPEPGAVLFDDTGLPAVPFRSCGK